MERLVPFGKYYLLERINVGGMAEVFKAKTVGVEGFEKLVAIKRILPSVAEDEEFIKMFIDEAKITSQLSHANLAQTFDLGKINDAYYIAMEYVPGKDLRAVQERLKRRGERVPINVAAYVIGRVCEGLDYAHRKRDIAGRELHIVHRDVSPQNVIVSFEGEVKLIDFGIAKAANKITSTQAGILKGKFGYMSPEQVRGLPLDQRSDIFAAGVVLYELCTGERLFTGSSDYSVLEKVQLAKITPPSEVVRDIPLRLEEVILKALARDTDQRYQHAADLSQDLTRFLIDSHTRIVSRDDVAAFMKAVFPDDDARERQAGTGPVERTRTGARRPDPPPPSEVRDDQPAQRQHHHEPRLREPPTRDSAPPVAQAKPPAPPRDSRDPDAKSGAPAPAKSVKPPSLSAPPPMPPPPPPRVPRTVPPKLPASLIAGIDLAAEDASEPPPRGPKRAGSTPEFSPTDPGPSGASDPNRVLKPPPLLQQSPRPPPLPAMSPPPPTKAAAPSTNAPSQSTPISAKGPSGSTRASLAAGTSAAAASAASSTAQGSIPQPSPISPPWTARDEDERTEPGLLRPPAEDEPTRPMSMDDLAAAERVFHERERKSAASAGVEIEVTTPGAPTQMTAHDKRGAAPGAVAVNSAASANAAAARGAPAASGASAAAPSPSASVANAGAASTAAGPAMSATPASSAAASTPAASGSSIGAQTNSHPTSPIARLTSNRPTSNPTLAVPAAPAAASPGAAAAASPTAPPAAQTAAAAQPEKTAPIVLSTAAQTRPAAANPPLSPNAISPSSPATDAPAKPIAAAPAAPPPTRSETPARPVSVATSRSESVRAQRPSKPPAPLPSSLLVDSKASGTAQITDPGGPPSSLNLFDDDANDDNTPSGRLRRGEPLRPAAPRSGSLPPPPRDEKREEKRPPFGGRMQLPKPTLMSDDPLPADESTISTFTRRARLVQLAKLGAIALMLVIAAWAWLSVPHKKEELAGPPTGSLSVTTKPEDALVFLDGSQVKGSLDRDYTEPKLPAGQDHVLIVRREGFTEQTQQLKIAPGDQKVLTIALTPLPGQLTVRSTPPGAQVFLDGKAMGTTPAYLPNVIQEQSHAISLEKRCYRPWQVAIPAHAGKREVVATLELIFGACPNMKVEREERAPELPTDDPAAMASLGFLSLGSRPSASIFIDGVDIGRTTPLVQWPLKVGKHKVRLVLARKKRELTVEVKSGQTASEIVDLRRN